MTRQNFGLIVTFIFWIAALAGCTGQNTSNTNAPGNTANGVNENSQNKGNDSAEELGTLIRIPFEPEEVTWRPLDEGGKKRVLAVLLFTPQDHKMLSSKYASAGSDVQVNVERWFPVELTAAGDTTGEMTINGKAFPATEFYQDPYNTGSVIFIPETNYVILDLQSN